jgi:ABC-type Fe3+ transport system substrate-binding protein
VAEALKIYWNNVCLLSRAEEDLINKTCQKLQGQRFEFEYFGLGKPLKMHQKIQQDLQAGNVKADALVCTDLDVFYNKKYLHDRLDEYQDLANSFPISNKNLNANTFHPTDRIQPALVIPLVIVVNTALLGKETPPESLYDLTADVWQGKVVFGGMDTSAGRSLLLSLWYLYGEEAMHRFIRNASVTSVPAAAYSAVARGQFPVGIVPSIFAARHGAGTIERIWPTDGAVAIPSYVAIKNNTPDIVKELLHECLFSQQVQEFFSMRGYMIPVNPKARIPQWVEQNCHKTVYPDWEWIKKLDTERFDEICSSL